MSDTTHLDDKQHHKQYEKPLDKELNQQTARSGGSHRQALHTDQAPAAIGCYSQAVRVGNWVFISGQIPLDPKTKALVSDNFDDQAHQVFRNLQVVCEHAGGQLNQLAKISVFMVDLTQFTQLNAIMEQYFSAPYPARAAVEVSALPKDAQIEIEGILVLEAQPGS